MKRIAVVVLLLASACASASVHRIGAQSPSRSVPPSATAASMPSSAGVEPSEAEPAFRPVSLAVSTRSQLWVLGYDRTCVSGGCKALLRLSTDAGGHWRAAAVPTGMTITTGDNAAAGVSDVVFANQHDGWLFGHDFWTTHNAARTWHRVDLHGRVTQLTLSSTSVWAVVERCTRTQVCTDRLLRASIGNDQFTPIAVPQPPGADRATTAIATDASDIAVLVSGKPNTTDDRDQLDVSSDDGATWSTRKAACLNELGGELAIAPQIIWAMCPTGMSAATTVSRSQHAFAALDGPWGNLPNSAAFYAWDARDVLLVSESRAYVSNDAGRHWQPTRTPNVNSVWWWATLAFPSPTEGYALAVAPTFAELLRTTDAGRSWTTVHGPR